MYDPVYIRNENPLLRTLPVAGMPGSRSSVGANPPTSRPNSTSCAGKAWAADYYFEMSVIDGTVVAIDQRIAISAC